jgi:large subunit ribosomal protein L18
MDRKHKVSVRAKRVRGTAERPRLAVFRSLKQVYAQVIDDIGGRTLAQQTTFKTTYKSNQAGARFVGAEIAKRCLEKQIRQVVFDRRQRKYHGCIKALAEAAREGGLIF